MKENFFEKNPEDKTIEEPDGKGHIEELRHGQFSSSPEEIQRVRKEAKEQGKDPDLAERQFRKKLDVATARLRMIQQEEALRSLEKAGKRHRSKK